MKHSPVRTIWRKELRDTVRDRKTLLSMVVMPLILMPVIIIGMSRYTTWQMNQMAEKPATVGISEQEPLPSLTDTLTQTPKIELTTLTGDPRDAVNNESVDAAIVVPKGTAAAIAAHQPVALPVIIKSTNTATTTASARISAAIAAYSSTVTSQRLSAAGVDPSILSPVTIKPEDVSSQQEITGQILGYILPMFIVLWSIVGGQYTAIDVSAGEKERKTLEALLLTPAKRIDIVTGKFLAVSTVSAISVVLAITSLYASFKYGGLTNLNGTNLAGSTAAASAALPAGAQFSIEPSAVAIMLIVGLLTVAVFSSVILSIAIFANSYKEAQSYISPAYLVVVLPIVLLNTAVNITIPWWLFCIPAANGVALFKEVLLGVYDPLHISITIISLIIFSFISLGVAAHIYRKEKVLVLS